MAKPPKPWMLSEEETFGSFVNWRRTILYNLQQDKSFTNFLKPKATWNALTDADLHRGLADDPDDGQKKEQKVIFLNCMLGFIAQYSPHELNTEISSNCPSLDMVWQTIREYYGFKQSEAQFLKFTAIKWESGERPEKLYRRVMAHLQDNLLTTECNLLHNGAKPTSNEVMSPTVERLAVIKWMELIDPDLPALVARTFAYDLQRMTLKELQPQIRDAMDGFLDELKQKREDVQASQLKVDDADLQAARARMDRTFSRPQRSHYPPRGPPKSYHPPTSGHSTYPAHPPTSGHSTYPARKECRICKAEQRRYIGHTFGECDYVSKAEKRAALKSYKVSLEQEGTEYDMHNICDNFEDCDFHESS